MDILFDAFSPENFQNLFTLMWIGAIVICVGGTVVYVIAQRRYRRYPAHMAMHEWVYWSLFVPWIMVPLLAVIHVPFVIILLLAIPGMGPVRLERYGAALFAIVRQAQQERMPASA